MACQRRPAHLTHQLPSPLCAAWKCRVYHPAGVRAACLAHNDPHGEHDFGSFELEGERFFWKIDLYEEPDVKDANEEPLVARVLAIMLAEDY